MRVRSYGGDGSGALAFDGVRVAEAALLCVASERVGVVAGRRRFSSPSGRRSDRPSPGFGRRIALTRGRGAQAALEQANTTIRITDVIESRA